MDDKLEGLRQLPPPDSKPKFIRAAGVLVKRGDKYLAIKNDETGHVGLPFGKAEPNELMIHTARRECLEETGYRVEVNQDIPPFIETDKQGCRSYTYLAEIKGVDYLFKVTLEGRPCFLTKEELCNGTYSDYNKNMFAHFEKYI